MIKIIDIMSDHLEITISQSRNVIHVGNHLLLYINIRNPLNCPIILDSISYDVPMGFSLLMDEGECIEGRICKAINEFCNYFRLPNDDQTYMLKPRVHDLNKLTILENDVHIITLPFQVGAHFPNRQIHPGTYHLVFELKYRINTTRSGDPNVITDVHSQPIIADINVYSDLGWLITGGVIGGIVGAFLKNVQSPPMSPLNSNPYWNFFIGGILGLVLVVIFKRESNVQSFVSIEDAWGGFLIGVIAGYGGIKFIETYLTNPGLASNNTPLAANLT